MRTSNNVRLSNAATLLSIITLSLVVASCATTRQTRSVETSGFLGDYSQLTEGKGKQAQLVYLNEAADWSSYKSVMIDSVTFWGGSPKLTTEQQQMLTDDLYAALDSRLREHKYAVVNAPGVGVLRLRAAITEAEGASTAANAITSLIPQTRMLSTLGGMASDTALLVGEVSIEVDITDSITNERLAAGVDKRVGTKAVRAAFSEWKHVTEAFDYWAERIAIRLDELSNGEE